MSAMCPVAIHDYWNKKWKHLNRREASSKEIIVLTRISDGISI
jgi:hypothetical protein